MGQYDWTVSCGVSVNNNYSATQAQVTVSAIFNNVGWRYEIAAHMTVTCDDQSQGWDGAAVTTGVGSTGSVTIGSRTFLVNKTANARTISCSASIKDTSGNAYAGGHTRSGSKTATISALPSYTISFDANGGTGAPASIQKSHGIAIDLPTEIPTRNGYEFLGWATTSAGSASYNAGASYTGNANATLYAVWKALSSQGNNIEATIGTALNLTWTKFIDSYRHTIKYTFGEQSGTLTTGANTSYTWNIPMSLCNETPNAPFMDGTWTIETYDGTRLVGSNTYKLTLVVPDSVVPTFEDTLSNVNNYFTAYSTKHSKLRATLSTAGAYGSTVLSATMRYDDIDYSDEVEDNAVVLTTNELAIAGSRSVVITIVDSRGRTASVTRTITVYEYNNPRISSIDVDVYGNVATINVKGVIAPINNQNQKYITIKKIRQSDEQETTVVPKTALTSYTFDNTYTQTIADLTTETYVFIAILEDKVTSAQADIVSGIVCVSRYAGGKGLRLFKEAEHEGFVVDDIDYTITNEEYDEIYGSTPVGERRMVELFSKGGGGNLDYEEVQTPIPENPLVMPVANGGTGATTKEDVLKAFNVYSTTEQVIGTWIDGKPNYRKVIDFGYLSNASTKRVEHGITNWERITNITAIAQDSNMNALRIDTADKDGLQYSVHIAVTGSTVNITTGSNRSAFYCYVVLEYTKTTD